MKFVPRFIVILFTKMQENRYQGQIYCKQCLTTWEVPLEVPLNGLAAIFTWLPIGGPDRNLPLALEH